MPKNCLYILGMLVVILSCLTLTVGMPILCEHLTPDAWLWAALHSLGIAGYLIGRKLMLMEREL